jgi:hypothetical protein
MSEIKNEGGYTYIKDHGNWFQVDDNIDVDKIKGGEIFLLNGLCDRKECKFLCPNRVHWYRPGNIFFTTMAKNVNRFI